MIPILALVLAMEIPSIALAGQQPRRSTETLDRVRASLDAQRETVTLTVHPPEHVPVRWIIMDLPESRSWAKPTKIEPLAKHGVRATFRHPHATYAFVMTLDDDTRYRVSVRVSGRIELEVEAPPRPSIWTLLYWAVLKNTS